MFESNITKAEINELPLNRYEGTVLLIEEKEAISPAIAEINQFSIVGFDTETKPVFVKGQYNHVALVQIATPEKVYLFRINKTGLTQELIDLFENENMKKVGVGLADDLVFLKRIKPFNPNHFKEVNELVNDLNIEANGLRKLTAIILGFRISKNAQVSNWEAKTLNEKQIRYAATDAWVCLEMYERIKGEIDR
ncbi:MAG: 3'-5' exonuclease [Crocinitomicaceae bacterium]